MPHIPSYSEIFGFGHRAVTNIFDDNVIVEEKIDGCVTPGTPILCDDLVYRRADSLSVGSSILGVKMNNGRYRFCSGKVTHNSAVSKPCVIVKTDDRTIVCSMDHPFLVRGHKCKGKKKTKTEWCQAGQLRIGSNIVALPVWEKEETWESGYLAGMFDGEGAVVGPSDTHNTRRLVFYQKAGLEADNVERLLKNRGFPVHRLERQRDPKWKVAVALSIGGKGRGWTPMLEFLGSIRPPRLLAKANMLWNGAATGYCCSQIVCSVEPCDTQILAGISTSIGTYIANGLISHNSQFSFGLIDGELCARSKGKDIILNAPEKMFQKGIDTIKQLNLKEEWIYRGEYLNSPKHNTLAYLRTPKEHIIIFDIDTGNQCYLNRIEKENECRLIGLECVPCYFQGKINSFDEIKALLSNRSILGGCTIEGVVFKSYDKFGPDKKTLMGKYVNPEFQEKNHKEWKASNPKSNDIINDLIMTYRNENRWMKAIQHLRDNGELFNDPKDIGALIKEIKSDIIKEEEDAIKEALWKFAHDKITRGAVAGFPEWYKEKLIKDLFPES